MFYIFPAVMDIALGLIFLVAPTRAAILGADFTTTAGILSMWGFAYIICCPIVSKIVTPKNAIHFILSGCILLMLECAAFAFATTITEMYVLTALSGLACSCFFPPFQVWMKQADSDAEKPLSYSVGMYTLSWSMGFAIGPLIGGALMALNVDIGWSYAYVVAACACLFSAVGMFRVSSKMSAKGKSETEKCHAEVKENDAPDFALLAWICSGFGIFVVSIIRGNIPKEVVESPAISGTILFLLSAVQGVVGFLLRKSYNWMYSKKCILAFGACGVVSMLCFAFGASTMWYIIGAIIFGIYSGSFFFYFVYHSLAHPSKSTRNIAVNETIVGVLSIVSPIVGGIVADMYGGFGTPFKFTAVIACIVVGLQAYIHHRYPWQNVKQ